MADVRAAPCSRRHWLTLFADGCHAGLSVALWTGGNLLAALGIVLMVAILAAGGEPLVFFAHLDNLASHYLAGSAERREVFDRQLLGFVAAILALLTLARLPAFAQRLRRELDPERRRD